MSVGSRHGKSVYRDATVLVTGGTGSIGLELVRTLLKREPKEVRIFTNDENGLFEISDMLDAYKNVKYYLGDVRDQRGVERVMSGCDVVFHAAALKHVIFCEANPYEAISTNIIGTQNVIDASVKYSVKRFVFVSTDKAVNPVSAMGATKLLGERLVATVAKLMPTPVFSVVRFGNVLGSRGSVLVVFQRQIKEGGPITITNPMMTRFVMAPSDTSALITRAAEEARSGELFVLKMKTVEMGEFAEACKLFFSRIYHKDPNTIKTRIIGAQPGEKMHEQIMTSDEVSYGCDLGDYFLINPHPSRKHAEKPIDSNQGVISSMFPHASRSEVISMLSELYQR